MMTKPIVALICFLLVNALCVYGGYQWADNSWQSDWDIHMLADSKANGIAVTNTLLKQQKLIEDLDNAKRKAADLQVIHDRNVADNRAANERLREQFDKLKSALSTSNNPDTIISSAAAATDRLVLAKLLEQSHTDHGIVGKYADENRKALMVCIDEYEIVRIRLNEKMD